MTNNSPGLRRRTNHPVASGRRGNHLPSRLWQAPLASVPGITGNSFRSWRFARSCRLILIAALSLAGVVGRSADTSHAPSKSADLFRGTNIWNVHFTFTAEQWEAMEPKGGGFMGGFRGPGGRGG